MFEDHILSWITFLPLIGMAAIVFVPKTNTSLVKMIALVATVGFPALLMAMMLTGSLRQTLRLYWPNWRILGAAILLPLALHPLSLEMLTHLQELEFFPTPPAAGELSKMITDASLPLIACPVSGSITCAMSVELPTKFSVVPAGSVKEIAKPKPRRSSSVIARSASANCLNPIFSL